MSSPASPTSLSLASIKQAAPQIPITQVTNQPIWLTLDPSRRGGYQEVWYLKLNDPDAQRAMWLRFTLLQSDNGFKRAAEVWAIVFHRKDSKDVSKLALKQTQDIRAFSSSPSPSQEDADSSFRIGDCEFGHGYTRGQIQSKGRTIKWDLKFVPSQTASFNFVPESLARTGIVKNRVFTPHSDLRFTGTSEVDGERHEWKAVPGMQGHLAGPKNGHSWVWGHCNSFFNEQGHPVPFVFEGLSARSRLGPVPSPQLSALFFIYQGKEYRFNSLWDAVRCRSQHSLTEWKFSAERGDLLFRGHAGAEHRDFAGITYEDTDGSLLFCANSKLSEMQVVVYRRGKLEATFNSSGTAAFEVVSRHKNPYVPLLI